MADSLFNRSVIPVASEMDATQTCEAGLPYLCQTGGAAHIVHVIEKTEGYPDKASVEQLEQRAERIFNRAIETFTNADIYSSETHLLYGADVAGTIHDACTEVEATAVVL